jgi:hypothetical protein
MGAIFGGPKVPPLPTPPPSAMPATMANPAVLMQGQAKARGAKTAEGAGFGGTVANTGGQRGLAPASTAAKSLLG